MKKLLFSLVLLFTLSMTSWSQTTDKAYEETVMKMLEVSKSMDAMKQIGPQMVAMIKQQAPTAPAEFFDNFVKVMDMMYPRIVIAMVPVYQKYFTIEDLKEIIKFYETPIGKKLATANVSMTTECMAIGQKIGMETMQEVMQEAVEKGYLKK